jgi:hypothetical protein
VSFVGSSNEVNSSVSINSKPTESEGDFADLLDAISYKLKIKGAPDLPLHDDGSADNIDSNLSNNFCPVANEDDFADLYDGVSYNSEDEWLARLALQDENPMITVLELNRSNNFIRHQCVP